MCYIKLKCSRWREIIWNSLGEKKKKKRAWELEQDRQRGDHSGIKVRRIQRNPLNTFVLSEVSSKGFLDINLLNYIHLIVEEPSGVEQCQFIPLVDMYFFFFSSAKTINKAAVSSVSHLNDIFSINFNRNWIKITSAFLCFWKNHSYMFKHSL